MRTSEFNSLSKPQLLDGARQAIKQSNALYNAAQLGAASGNFGIANSLMILAVEEAIKSFILLSGYFSIELKFSIEPFFHDHKTKHKQAAEIQPMISFVWKVRDLFITLLKGKGGVFDALIVVGFLLAVDKINEKESNDDFAKWWQEANTQKNNGFYVGYCHGRWNFPGEITESKYLETVRITKPFIECLQIAEKLDDNDYKLIAEGNLGILKLGSSEDVSSYGSY